MVDIKISDKAKLLADCIIASIDGNDFRWEDFFGHWFRDNGDPFYFLFKKNLSVTNTQFVELFSLLNLHSKNTLHPTREAKLLFHSTEHIRLTFTETISSLLENYQPGDAKSIYSFCDRYLDIFMCTVAVDMFFGSCAVFIPKGIDLDLEKVVYDSGYVHSAGKSVFIRNIKKATKKDFINGISTYLEANISDTKIPFIVYSHEDFSGHDKTSFDLIDKGIEQCKIFIEKMSMGSNRLSTIVDEIREQFQDRLIVPIAGPYTERHQFKNRKTIWLITDRSVSTGQIKNPGFNRYYICYEQYFKNDSPFFFFDENKPAWKSHTTLPHSLAAALINISRPIKNGGTICDPFGGTGTTWLEVKRLQLPNEIISSDLSDCAIVLLRDNLNFFTMSSDELLKLKKSLDTCISVKMNIGQHHFDFENIALTLSPYGQVHQLLESLRAEQKGEDQEFYLSRPFVDHLITLPFLTRIVFYIGLRSELRYQSSFKRKTLTFETAFKKSLDKLVEQIKIFIDLKREIEPDEKISPSGYTYVKSLETYSYRLTPKLLKDGNELLDHIHKEVFSGIDARDLQIASNDLVICDPPYGFNTSEGEEELPCLYSEFIEKAIASLRPMGQLIICLPAESYTGRSLPYCTRSDLISRQIIIKAHQLDRIIYRSAQSLPLSSLSAPYYWESDRALRRIILHYRFL